MLIKLLHNPVIKKTADKFPFLKRIRRYFLAYKDSIMPRQKTYSQFSEDLIVSELLPELSPSDFIYIEVGANHPTQISNTYLFYRLGFTGIIIEPNHEMLSLLRRFRPKDIILEIGCSDRSGIGNFKISESSVISGFSENIKAVSTGQLWVPLLTVDEIWRDAGNEKKVLLLSIDTEGFDLMVLNGARETLKHTICIVVETSDSDVGEIKKILNNSGFKLMRTTDCNFIWMNERALF
jgi:FkbM family methyltransferase